MVGQWEGGGTHTGPAFDDLPVGSLPAASGKKMHFTGITVLRVKDGLIVEELGLDDGVTVLKQLARFRPVGGTTRLAVDWSALSTTALAAWPV